MRRGGAIRDWIGKGERLSGVGASVGCNVDGAHWDMEFADGPGLVISRESLNENALPSNPAVESIPRKDEVDGLKGATRDTQKGVYQKTRHAPDLLMNLDREK